MTIKNVNKVSLKMWRHWSSAQRACFNETFARIEFQDIFKHPEMIPMRKEYWHTIRWNAAFTAAIIYGEVRAVEGRLGEEPKKRRAKRCG